MYLCSSHPPTFRRCSPGAEPVLGVSMCLATEAVNKVDWREAVLCLADRRQWNRRPDSYSPTTATSHSMKLAARILPSGLKASASGLQGAVVVQVVPATTSQTTMMGLLSG